MSDLREAAAISARGGFTLLIGNSISLLVSAAGAVLVARFLSSSDYGLFGVSLVLPSLFILLAGWGIDSSLIRFISSYRSEGNILRIKDVVKTGISLKLALGGVLSLIQFFLADFLATFLLKRPETGVLLRFSSVLIFSESLHGTLGSILAGLEKMDLLAYLSITQAFVKGFLSPILVYWGFGVRGAVLGYVLSFVASSLVGLIFIISQFFLMRNEKKIQGERSNNLKLILGFGVPLYLGSVFSGFSLRFQNFLVSWHLTDIIIGNYNVASSFTALVGLVTGSIQTTLFPTFSKFSFQDDSKNIFEVFRSSVRYASIIVIPFVFLLATVSRSAIYTLYTAKYPEAPLFLSLLLIPILFVGTGSLSIGNLFNSQGDTETTMKISILSSMFSVASSIILISQVGVIGLIITIILTGLIDNLSGLILLKKKYNIELNLKHTGSTVLSSIIPSLVVYVLTMFLSSQLPFISLITSTAVFLGVYLILAPITGTITDRDIENLYSITKDLRIIHPFAKIFFNFEKLILNFVKKW
jgi:O-antigen/teichoic acid export membrane protein